MKYSKILNKKVIAVLLSSIASLILLYCYFIYFNPSVLSSKVASSGLKASPELITSTASSTTPGTDIQATSATENSSNGDESDSLSYDDFFAGNKEVIIPFQFISQIPPNIVIRIPLMEEMRAGKYVKFQIQGVTPKEYDHPSKEASKRIWGVRDNQSDVIQLDYKNSFDITKEEEIRAAFEIWKAKNWSHLKIAAHIYDIDSISKTLKESKASGEKVEFEFNVFEALHDAEEIPLMNEYLDQCVDISEEDIKKILMVSISTHDYPLFIKFISKVKLPGLRFPVDISPLAAAVIYANKPVVEQLLKMGVDIHERDGIGNTVLSYLSGNPAVTGVEAYSHDKERIEIAELLIEKGLGINDNSKSENFDPLQFALRMENIDIASLLIKKNVINRNFKFYLENEELSYHFFKNEIPAGETKTEIEKYDKLKSLIPNSKTSLAESNWLLGKSISLNDKEGFDLILKHTTLKTLKLNYKNPLKPKYNYCLLNDVSSSRNTYYLEKLMGNLIKPGSSCENAGFNHEKIENLLINKCLSKHLEKFGTVISPNYVVADDLENSDFMRINDQTRHFYLSSTFECASTFKALKNIGKQFTENEVLIQLLMSNNIGDLKFFLAKNVFSPATLASGLNIVDSPSLKIDLRDYKIIGEQISHFYRFMMKKMNIKEHSFLDPIVTGIDIPFENGRQYPLCGRYTSTNLYDKIGGTVVEVLPFCFEVEASLFGTTLVVAKIENINSNWIKLEIERTTDMHDRELPDRIVYAKKHELTSAFVLTDGSLSIPISVAGLTGVSIHEHTYSISGSEDPCHGTPNPQIERKGSSGNPLPDKFEVEKAKLIKNIPMTVTKSCGT